MTKKKYIIWSIAYLFVIGVYFCLIFRRNFYIQPFAAYDSALQVKLASYLVKGQWLGPYNSITLAKGISYPFFLAVLHFLKVPLWIGLGMFNLVAVGICCVIISVIISNNKLKWGLFTLLILNPVLFDTSQVTLYRDSLSYGLILLILAWIVGTFISVIKKKFSLFLCATFVGIISLPFWNNLREDAFWMYPFVIVGLFVSAVTAIVIYRKLKWKLVWLVLMLLPFSMSYIVNQTISKKNLQYYGSFVVNDYNDGTFKSAYGALTNIKTNSWVINVPVNTEMREKAYRSVPAFKKLEQHLDNHGSGSMESFKNFGVKEPSRGNDYQGGWFFWALRGAVYDSGYGDNSKNAQKYYKKIAKETNQAIATGKLNGYRKERESLTPKFNRQILVPTMKYIIKGSVQTVLYTGLKYQVKFNHANFMNPYFHFMSRFTKTGYPLQQSKQKITYKVLFLHVMRWGEVFVTILGFVMILICFSRTVKSCFNRNIKLYEFMYFTLTLGILLEILLRLVMIGYVSTTSFKSFNIAYLSSIYPLFTIQAILSITYFDYLKSNKKIRYNF